MYKYFVLTIIVLSSCSRDLILTDGSNTDFVIVVSEHAGEMELKAAREFQRLLALCSSVELSIITEAQKSRGCEIVIGDTHHGLPHAVGDLQADGFTIQTAGKKLFIQGGSGKGCLYGVYTFFETFLGFRCFSPDVFKYPSLQRVKVPADILDTQIPINVYRNTFYEVANDPFYADWHKLKNYREPDWGLFVHTFDRLVPVNTYFDDHPEYFAFVDGTRVRSQAPYIPSFPPQLCLTNLDVLRVVIENLSKMMEEKPEALYWSVSSADTGEKCPYACTCDDCAALDEASDSPSGSVITFVNKVAQRFPDKIISTLAYRYTRKAPKAVKPLPNVNIMLCTIECDRNYPIENDATVGSFRYDFDEWSKITDNFIMWDYVIQFSNLMAPFPNLRVLQPNMQYFVRNGVSAHFQQGNISKGGEFCELRPYLIAKLLWNPDVDLQAVMTDFLEGYYEEAGSYIAQYIELMHNELERSGLKLTIYGNPADHAAEGFLRDELMDQYNSFFDDAEKSVQDKPDVLERVRTARLPLTFSLFEIAKRRGVTETRVFENTGDAIRVRPEILKKLDNFQQLCNKTGVHLMQEGRLTPDEYCERLKSFLINIKQN